MSCHNSIYFFILLFLALLPCEAKIRSCIHHSRSPQPEDFIKVQHNLLSVYIKQQTEATPATQFPPTFMNKNLSHLSLWTFIRAKSRTIIKLSSLLLLSTPDGTSSLSRKMLNSHENLDLSFCVHLFHHFISINAMFLVLFGHIRFLQVRFMSSNWHSWPQKTLEMNLMSPLCGYMVVTWECRRLAVKHFCGLKKSCCAFFKNLMSLELDFLNDTFWYSVVCR